MRNIRSRQMRARNRNPQKNQRSQNTPIRNEFEPSDQRFWAEGSDKGLSTQHLRPNIEPIYQVNTLRSGRIWPANVEHCPQSWTLGQTFLEKLLLIWLLSSMFCK